MLSSKNGTEDGGFRRSSLEIVASLAAENEVLSTAAGRDERILACATEHAVMVLDRGGRITGWRAGAEAITGYAADDALGLSGAILLPEAAAGRSASPSFWAVPWRTGGRRSKATWSARTARGSGRVAR